MSCMFDRLLKIGRPAGKVPLGPAIPLGFFSIFCGLALPAAFGCAKKQPSVHEAVAPPKPDPWFLYCNDPNAEEPALLWNGLLGVRIGRDATFVGNRFEIDSYEKTGEEKIIPLPCLLNARWKINGQEANPRNGGGYVQALNMREGALKTNWKQGQVSIECLTSIGPDRKEVGQLWTFTGLKASTKLVLEPAKATQDYAFSSWQVREQASPSPLSLHANILVPDKSGKAVASLVWYRLNESAEDSKSDQAIAPNDRSKRFWQNQWKTDIEIDGPVEDQQAIRSFMYYLRSSIHPKGKMSISPFGLSDATYNGHVFWDADTWVFPALALIDPERAKAIADYRLAKFEKNNPLPPTAPFPWESSVSGKEVAPGQMFKEIHINGSVAWMLDNAAALGIVKQQDSDRIVKRVADYYLARAERMSEGIYELKDVISPDEFHSGDNDLYTNLLAQWMQRKVRRNVRFKLPRDEKTYLTYDNDPVRSYKQAAAVLGIYPLQMIDDAQARKMMDRFADKVTKNGPAMSRSVHALIWARLGDTEKAYDEWKRSWQFYTNHPLMLFAEKPKKKTTYFTTGAAGCLQTVLYGFLGFRIDYEKDKMAAWSTPLNNGKWISIRPRLPAQWKRVKFTNFIVKGKRYNLTIDANGVKVNQGEP